MSLSEGVDYKYLSRYDDRYKGYLITITFYRAGSFKPEYFFNMQSAVVNIENGPAMFFVDEPICKGAKMLTQG